jgi:hypothetical protein
MVEFLDLEMRRYRACSHTSDICRPFYGVSGIHYHVVSKPAWPGSLRRRTFCTPPCQPTNHASRNPSRIRAVFKSLHAASTHQHRGLPPQARFVRTMLYSLIISRREHHPLRRFGIGAHAVSVSPRSGIPYHPPLEGILRTLTSSRLFNSANPYIPISRVRPTGINGRAPEMESIMQKTEAETQSLGSSAAPPQAILKA